MDVLIACEESQIVCMEFRKLGYNAFSCDNENFSGNFPEYHLMMDARKAVKLKKWDLIIAHPPCDRLANSGVRWLEERQLFEEFQKAVDFFNFFVKLGKGGQRIAIENPIQHSYARQYIEKYDQLIQPYQFGHPEQKSTCLWLFGLPKLKSTNNVYKEMMKLPIAERQKIWYMGGINKEQRSKTYQGIAEAMAKQWSNIQTPYNKLLFYL